MIHNRNYIPSRRERAIFHDFVKGVAVIFLVQKYGINDGNEASLLLRRVGRYYERNYGNKTKTFYITPEKQAFRDFTNGRSTKDIQRRFGWVNDVLGKVLRDVGELYETFFRMNC